MKPKHVYIQPETDAALAKLGGKTRAENIRRAVALAEWAEDASKLLHSNEDDPDTIERIYHCLKRYQELTQ